MARRFVIQHKTSGAFLGLYPSLSQDPMNPPDISGLHVVSLDDAASYSTFASAELERQGIADFDGAYAVVTVELAPILDTPRLLPEPRPRGQEEPEYPEDLLR